jgi:hypothetical protein
MKYPIVMVAEWQTWQSSYRLVVEFSSKNIGKVLESNHISYKVGETYTDFFSAENRKKWRPMSKNDRLTNTKPETS